MNPGQNRQAEADAINAQVVEDMKTQTAAGDAVNEQNRENLVKPTIAELQQRLDALRLQRPEDDTDIEALKNQIEALQQNS